MKGKNRHAVILGRKGGKKKSVRKARAARENGKLGGYPRKKLTPMVEVGVDRSEDPVLTDAVDEMRQVLQTIRRPEHDVKACRIYRCLQCKALGHKDRNRGLL